MTSVTESKTWTSEAGPRQNKAVQKAIRELTAEQRTWTQLTGTVGGEERETALWSPFSGPVNDKAVELCEQLGDSFDWKVTRGNHKEIIAEAGRLTLEARKHRPIEDKRETKDETAARVAKIAKQDAEYEAKADEDRRRRAENVAALEKTKPANAVALIVAELDKDESESMTDYFNHTTSRCVAIGWRTGKREDFRQLRKAAATFEPTAHMGPGCDIYKAYAYGPSPDGRPEWDRRRYGFSVDGGMSADAFPTEEELRKAADAAVEKWDDNSSGFFGLYAKDNGYEVSKESVEHRDNYSMGGGNYLKAGHTHGNGWRVRSWTSWESQADDLDEIHIAEPAKPGQPETTAAGIQKVWNAKKQRDAYIVKLNDRVDRAAFLELKSSALRIGGGYSRFAGGFSFRTLEMAQEFAGILGVSNTDDDDPKPPTGGDSPEKTGGKLPDAYAAKMVERFEGWAERYEADAREKEREPSRLNTPKQRCQYAARRHDARGLRAAARVCRQLAALHGRNECPPELRNLLKKDIEKATHYDRDYAREGYYDVIGLDTFCHSDERSKIIQRYAGNETPEERDAREIAELEREIANQKIEGYWPTPDATADRVIEAADIQHGHKVLEPSAGSGQLAVRAKAKAGDSVGAVIACERHADLVRLLKLKGVPTIHGDFMERFTPGSASFDRIVMNPPFERGQDIEHVRRAFDLLNPGGRLVAIMSAGSFQRSDRKATEFQEWADEAGAVVEDMNGAFHVSTRLLIVDRSEGGAE